VDGATRDARREGRTRGRENARIGTSDANLRTDEDGSTRRRQRAEAEKILQSLQEHEQTWTRVDGILETSKNANTKFFALQVLDGVIKYRWGLLPNDQREGIKNFVSNLIIKLSADETTFRRDRAYINKINNVLVQILKHDWPHRWQSFIPDLVGAARTSESLCENCMSILKLLSEEVFDFSRGEMTQDKIRALKTSLNSEFKMIHELCEFVLTHSQKPELIKTTLTTLNAFLSWIPLGYIFESSLLDTLLALAPNPAYRNIAFLCLSEIGGLNVEAKYDAHFIKLYTVAVEHLLGILPRGVNIAQAYANGTDDEQAFVQNLGIFLTQFFKAHIVLLESTAELQQSMLIGIEYLLNISYVEEPEVFKVCLDYWHFMVCDVFQSEGGDAGDFRFGGDVVAQNERGVNRRVLYAAPFSKLRLLMISRMAKPEEVLIVEDENGNIVRETLKDNDVLVQYKIMRETLIYLAHLDHKDTETQMLEKLHAQLNGREYTWHTLNTLCWAIGSISGSMQEDQENRFLVTAIRDLLNLCEIMRMKDHKAVIASNIMYVVGQYPRFLRLHWKFLKTVVNKLFEFMHETHPGVQDMACDTFLKISMKCKRKFVILQVGETEPFVDELLRGLSDTIRDLEPHQVHTFYESVGHMIGSELNPAKREEYVQRLMAPPNEQWQQIMTQARQNSECLKNQDVIKNILNILKSNTHFCMSLGQPFQNQMSAIYADVLNVYKLYSELVSQSIAEGGPYASKSSFVKLLRSVKREVLRLIETFVERCDDPHLVAQQLVPQMYDPILGDYARNIPDARDAEVLSLFAAIINKVETAMTDEIPKIFDAVFECTLSMITKNFEDFPDHRLKFFLLLRSVTNHCFRALVALSPAHLKLIIDSIVWAFRHTERNVADEGLNLLLEMMKYFQLSEYCNQFHQSFYLMTMSEVFAVMTDGFHKPGFKLHALILQNLFTISESDQLSAPLWDVAAKGAGAYPSNAAFVQEHCAQLLCTSFPNMPPAEVQTLVLAMFQCKNDLAAFKSTLRDFLVQTKQFSSVDFAEEEQSRLAAQRQARLSAIPGMVSGANVGDMDDDE
jgi:exportin-1